MYKNYIIITILLFAVFLSSCSGKVARLSDHNFPALEDSFNDRLEARLQQVVDDDIQLKKLASRNQLGLALVDIRTLHSPKVAAINPYKMIYAASTPKSAILYSVLKKVDEGKLKFTPEIEKLCIDMMRVSSNTAATSLFNIVGPDYLAQQMLTPPHRLYDINRGGGLWVGKEYAKGMAWLRDPLHGISHAATPMSLAKLYYLLETGQLLSDKGTSQMKRFMSGTLLNHKMAKGLGYDGKKVKLYRKSGSWSTYYSDSAIVYHGRKRYIAVILINHENGEEIIENLIQKMDYLASGGWF